MKKSKSKAPKVDPFVEGLMAKLLDRLVSLEKKMDTVISQTSKTVSSGGQQPQQIVQQPRKERQLYEAICADCSKVCEVPFRPSENRAVYCKACFAKRKGMGHGMPKLTQVTLPPKPVSRPLPPSPLDAKPASKKAKKSAPKKTKKKK